MIARIIVDIGMALILLGILSFVIGFIIFNPMVLVCGYGTLVIAPAICILGLSFY